MNTQVKTKSTVAYYSLNRTTYNENKKLKCGQEQAKQRKVTKNQHLQ
jgi:hypothetical protein